MELQPHCNEMIISAIIPISIPILEQTIHRIYEPKSHKGRGRRAQGDKKVIGPHIRALR